jgi:hypothetical protein
MDEPDRDPGTGDEENLNVAGRGANKEDANEEDANEEERADPDAPSGRSPRDAVWRAGTERVVTRDRGGQLPGLNTWGAEDEEVEDVDDGDGEWAPTTHRDGPERPSAT